MKDKKIKDKDGKFNNKLIDIKDNLINTLEELSKAIDDGSKKDIVYRRHRFVISLLVALIDSIPDSSVERMHKNDTSKTNYKSSFAKGFIIIFKYSNWYQIEGTNPDFKKYDEYDDKCTIEKCERLLCIDYNNPRLNHYFLKNMLYYFNKFKDVKDEEQIKFACALTDLFDVLKNELSLINIKKLHEVLKTHKEYFNEQLCEHILNSYEQRFHNAIHEALNKSFKSKNTNKLTETRNLKMNKVNLNEKINENNITNMNSDQLKIFMESGVKLYNIDPDDHDNIQVFIDFSKICKTKESFDLSDKDTKYSIRKIITMVLFKIDYSKKELLDMINVKSGQENILSQIIDDVPICESQIEESYSGDYFDLLIRDGFTIDEIEELTGEDADYIKYELNCYSPLDYSYDDDDTFDMECSESIMWIYFQFVLNQNCSNEDGLNFLCEEIDACREIIESQIINDYNQYHTLIHDILISRGFNEDDYLKVVNSVKNLQGYDEDK